MSITLDDLGIDTIPQASAGSAATASQPYPSLHERIRSFIALARSVGRSDAWIRSVIMLGVEDLTGRTDYPVPSGILLALHSDDPTTLLDRTLWSDQSPEALQEVLRRKRTTRLIERPIDRLSTYVYYHLSTLLCADARAAGATT